MLEAHFPSGAWRFQPNQQYRGIVARRARGGGCLIAWYVGHSGDFIKGTANPDPNQQYNTNLRNLAAHLLRRRVESVQKTFKTLESQLANAREICMTLEILESKRHHVHDGRLAEETKWIAERACLEGVRHAVSALEYCKTNVRGPLDQTMADSQVSCRLLSRSRFFYSTPVCHWEGNRMREVTLSSVLESCRGSLQRARGTHG